MELTDFSEAESTNDLLLRVRTLDHGEEGLDLGVSLGSWEVGDDLSAARGTCHVLLGGTGSHLANDVLVEDALLGGSGQEGVQLGEGFALHDSLFGQGHSVLDHWTSSSVVDSKTEGGSLEGEANELKIVFIHERKELLVDLLDLGSKLFWIGSKESNDCVESVEMESSLVLMQQSKQLVHDGWKSLDLDLVGGVGHFLETLQG